MNKTPIINRRLFSLTFVLLLCVFLSGCAKETGDAEPSAVTGAGAYTDAGVKAEDNTTAAPEPKTAAGVNAEISDGADSAGAGNRNERVIDFPFSHGREEKGYLLTLLAPEEASGDYELKLCDKTGRILQQFFCGPLKEPVEFSYDRLVYGPDLQIFSAGSPTGLLFTWNGEDRFTEKAIEIPRYDSVWNNFFTAAVENGSFVERTIYQVNESQGRAERLRGFRLDRSDGYLKIWDYPENCILFEGNIELQEDGNPVNSDYYEYLFRDRLYRIWDYRADSVIPTWIMENSSRAGEKSAEQSGESSGKASGFEMMQKIIFGNAGSTAEYESRRALLEDFGFWETEPFYCYFDRFGNLALELYLDEHTHKGCGIVYRYQFTDSLEKIVDMQGFTIDSIMEQDAWKMDPYLLKSVDGTDGADSVTEYKEESVYTEDGKPVRYLSSGVIDWLSDTPEKQDILSFHFIYREDGSLCYREYYHNGFIFMTPFSYRHSYFDEKERPVYENTYITHGSLEYYYIYGDGKAEPDYCLCLDLNMGYAIPSLVKFR